jgi:selenide,water dikinase
LAGLGTEGAPDALIAGLHPPDDAAAYRVSDDLAIIGTLDFFPPLVDDAWTFGEIAAANAMSDVFAMGGRVLFALSIAAFPEDLPRDVMAAVFGGASAKVREGGGVLAGGHTIRDPEPKYGLAVIGSAHPDRLLRRGGARPGDSLILTKRLGTGLLLSGRRRDLASDADVGVATDQMRVLNRAASDVLVANGVLAATDITGFGLLGHGLEMARASSARLVFDTAALPALPGALEMARAGVETDGATHNRRFVADDPQTSGGLLAAVAGDQVGALIDGLNAAGVETWQVGRVEAGAGVALS